MHSIEVEKTLKMKKKIYRKNVSDNDQTLSLNFFRIFSQCIWDTDPKRSNVLFSLIVSLISIKTSLIFLLHRSDSIHFHQISPDTASSIRTYIHVGYIGEWWGKACKQYVETALAASSARYLLWHEPPRATTRHGSYINIG